MPGEASGQLRGVDPLSKLADLAFMADGLAVDGILEPLQEGLQLIQALLEHRYPLLLTRFGLIGRGLPLRAAATAQLHYAVE